MSFKRRVASVVITRRLRRLERGRGAVTGSRPVRCHRPSVSVADSHPTGRAVMLTTVARSIASCCPPDVVGCYVINPPRRRRGESPSFEGAALHSEAGVSRDRRSLAVRTGSVFRTSCPRSSSRVRTPVCPGARVVSACRDTLRVLPPTVDCSRATSPSQFNPNLVEKGEVTLPRLTTLEVELLAGGFAEDM